MAVKGGNLPGLQEINPNQQDFQMFCQEFSMGTYKTQIGSHGQTAQAPARPRFPRAKVTIDKSISYI